MTTEDHAGRRGDFASFFSGRRERQARRSVSLLLGNGTTLFSVTSCPRNGFPPPPAPYSPSHDHSLTILGPFFLVLKTSQDALTPDSEKADSHSLAHTRFSTKKNPSITHSWTQRRGKQRRAHDFFLHLELKTSATQQNKHITMAG